MSRYILPNPELIAGLSLVKDMVQISEPGGSTQGAANILVGAILLGDLRGSKEVQQAIKANKDVSSVKNALADENFDFKKLA